ncbi:helix-turn-helix domain-containing protein [Mitsuokella jalaludinii]|uniref:helix-turn-helix domain-containing protein n=1 Tax=Mitsuokella jalaludinii TaxID=187979 RepID=UPI003F9A1658
MVGDKLRAEREKQGLTVKDIEKGTSIRALYIECIEKGDYEQLPGEVYTKGFIRNYANYLKLNATELVRAFVAERHPEKAAAASAAQAAKTPAAPAEPNTTAAPAQQVRAAGKSQQAAGTPAAPAEAENVNNPSAAPQKKTQRPATPVHREQKIQKPAPALGSFSASQAGGSNRSKFVLLAVVLIVVVGAAAYLLGSSSSETPAAAPQQTQQQAAAPQKTYDGVEVTGKFSDDCWIEVKADGKVIYEGTLKKGDSMDWKGQENVTVRAGNAGAVEFTVNGKALGKAGKEGQVANKTFTKDAN